jgi:ribosomal protein S27E
MAWMHIACGGCGHEADIDAFTRTAVFGELPKNTFQCPACGLAIERRMSGPGVSYGPGRYVSGPVELVVVESRL